MKFVLDTHLHTVASGHAYSTVKEYLDEAARKGLELIAITDHAPSMPGASDSIYFLNLFHIPKVINGVELLKGAELNIKNASGKVDLSKGLLKKMDVVIASLHTPCLPPLSFEENTLAVLNVMDNPYVGIIGHLGDPRYPMDFEDIILKAKKTKTVIELNNASLNPSGVRAGGDEIIFDILKLCVKYEVNISIGSDAHFYSYVGDFGYAEDMLKRAEVPEELVLNTGIDKFKMALAAKREIYDELT